MTDWIHCNNCFRRPGDNLRFFLTNCAHIFCQVCIEKVTNNNKCSRCHKSCTTIPLTSQLKPDVEIFFQDPVDILKKHQKQLIQILEFQQNHRQLLASHQNQEVLKQKRMLAEANKGFEKLKVMENEIKSLSDENKYLRSLLEESSLKRRHGTPGGHILSKTSPAVKHRMTLSQSSSPSLGSPYSPFKLKVNRSQDVNHTPQMIRTPQGPARISLRTPPINGRLGTTPGSSGTRSSGYPKRPNTTPGGLDLPTTPGLSQASPMLTSPMYYRNSGDGVSGGSRLMSSSQSQSSQSQIRRYMMDNNKYTTKYVETSSRTPIQLRNTHHKPLISTPHSSQPVRT